MQEDACGGEIPAGRHDDPAVPVAPGGCATTGLAQPGAVDDADDHPLDLVTMRRAAQVARVPVHVDAAGAHFEPDRAALVVPSHLLGRERLAADHESREDDHQQDGGPPHGDDGSC